ncbi:hypothetical protein [Variovorax ginsengisoli]|uniref:Glutathione S-transferase n=1 Tax=Variovorax ginsengisoli TaxID=363844 RepID=A0ABT9S8Z2_9BURK|nr:hypothetical protein [Variovorax ginsengisoli]MDP9900820.1 glutathione S-transferase [Variovorax ginsengisoli]
MELYTFFNSSASYRVRIAMALKDEAILARNPFGLVPTLVDESVHRSANAQRMKVAVSVCFASILFDSHSPAILSPNEIAR